MGVTAAGNVTVVVTLGSDRVEVGAILTDTGRVAVYCGLEKYTGASAAAEAAIAADSASIMVLVLPAAATVAVVSA